MNKSQNERAIFSNFSQSKNESVSLFEPFYQPKWQISLFFHKCKPYPFTNSYCWSQKKLPLSVGPPRICQYKEYPHRDALYLVQYIYHIWCWVGCFFFFFFFTSFLLEQQQIWETPWGQFVVWWMCPFATIFIFLRFSFFRFVTPVNRSLLQVPAVN